MLDQLKRFILLVEGDLVPLAAFYGRFLEMQQDLLNIEDNFFANELHDNLADRFRRTGDGCLARLAYFMTPAGFKNFRDQRCARLSLDPFLLSARMAQQALLTNIAGLDKRMGALALAASRQSTVNMKLSRTSNPFSNTTTTPKARTPIISQSSGS
jgi:hypothetical protein